MGRIVKGEIAFVRILVPLVMGIAAAHQNIPPEWVLSMIAYSIAALFLIFACIVIFYKWAYNYNYRWIIGLLFSVLIFSAGYLLSIYKSQKSDPLNFSREKYEALVVVIRSEPRSSAGIIRFEAEVSHGFNDQKFYPVTGSILIAVKEENLNRYGYGDMLLIPAKYSEVIGPLNPGEFDYRAYLSDHHIYYQSFLNGRQVYLLKYGGGNPIVAYALTLRKRLVDKFSKYISDRDAASVASTLILGYRADLTKEVLDAYSKTGTMHVLSVSGMHVGIVFIVMVFLLQFMNRNRKLRLIRALLMIALIWIYAIITGFSPSVCRSAMMISFVIIGKALQRNQNTYNLLAISAVLLLLYDPFFLFDAGFQLSYLSVIGLVYLYPKIYKRFYFKYWFADQIWSYISVSTAAQFATFPLSMYYFHQFPVYFLVSNIFIILPVAVIMYAGLLFLFIPWDLVLGLLGWLLNNSIILTNKGLFLIENMPFANIEGIWISTWTYLAIYAFIFLMVYAFMYRSKVLIYSSLIVLFLLLASRSINTIDKIRNHQIIIYSLRKNTGISFLDGKNAFIITDLIQSDKTFSYAISPSLSFNSIENITAIAPGSPFDTGNLFYDGNFIQFRNKTMLIWDKKFDNTGFTKRVRADILLLQGNPRISVEELVKCVTFKILIMDGSNMDHRIKGWQKEAGKIGLTYYSLKGNPAYVVKM